MERAALAPPTSQVPRRSFDSIFKHILIPDDALKAELRAAGFDPDHPQPNYPTPVFRECLDLARKRMFPSDSVDEGWRKLGQKWVEGFTQTAVGMVIGAAARLIGTERCLSRLPSYWKAGRDDVHIYVEAVAPRFWRLKFQDPVAPRPNFVQGVTESILGLTGVKRHDVTISRDTPAEFELHIRWE